jgi:predicted nucleic acid-binding protein
MGQVFTSAIVVFEVFHGCRSEREERAASALFELLPVTELDAAIATLGARIARSQPGIFSNERAASDALIAATAVARLATLITLNTRQFARLRVPGLKILAVDQTAPDWVAALPPP